MINITSSKYNKITGQIESLSLEDGIRPASEYFEDTKDKVYIINSKHPNDETNEFFDKLENDKLKH